MPLKTKEEKKSKPKEKVTKNKVTKKKVESVKPEKQTLTHTVINGVKVRLKKDGTPRQPRSTKYPWDEWLSKEKFSLTQGKHFKHSLTSMIQQVRNAASKRGYSTVIKEVDTTLKVISTKNK